MKHLNTYIIEKLHINKDTKVEPEYNYHPKDKDELRSLIEKLLKERGNNANLNDINTSDIIDMSNLFLELNPCSKINISNWDVSNVTDMHYMFYGCKNFNCDISDWDVSNVTDMRHMFGECKKFNSDLSRWDVSNVTDMNGMFNNCESFNSDLSKWNVRHVTDMLSMFWNCRQFHSDLSKWDVSNVGKIGAMFVGCINFEGDKLENWPIPQLLASGKIPSIYKMFHNCKSSPSWY